MADRSSHLCGTIRFEKGGDLGPRKMRTIVMKNAAGKSKDKD